MPTHSPHECMHYHVDMFYIPMGSIGDVFITPISTGWNYVAKMLIINDM